MNITYSFFLTLFSGFSTIIGSIIILIKFKNINKVITSTLAFSSGVMICLSIFDLLFEAIDILKSTYSIFLSIILFIIFFIIGISISILINKNIKEENSLYKTGIISMIAIIFHNIPEGILTFITSNFNRRLGLKLAIAITMHNIPEGISIAIPVYYSTNSKSKAFIYTLISALSEVVGAFISYIFLKQFINNLFIGILLSLVCGIMSYISIFELLKEAKTYKENNLCILSFTFGIIFMLINLIIN